MISVRMSGHELALSRIYLLHLYPLKERGSWLILLGALLFALGLNGLGGGSDHSPLEILFGALTLAGSWFLLVYSGHRRKDAVHAMYAHGFRLAIESDALIYSRDEAADRIPWSDFSSVVISRRWIFLRHRKWALVVPLTAFANRAAFREWGERARAHIPKLS